MSGLRTVLLMCRRGFAIRLKRPTVPDVGGLKILGARTIYSVSASNYICIFVLVQRTICYYASSKRPLKKNEREGLKWMTMSILFSWRWELVVVTYMCGTKRLNLFFRLHEASEVLNKYVMGVCSDNFTAAYFVSFIVTVFVADIEGIQNKVICLWIGTACSVNITSTCSANLYDVSRRKPSKRSPIWKSLGPRKWNFTSAYVVLSQKIWRALVYMNWIDSHRRVDEGVNFGNCRMNSLLFADELVLHAWIFSTGSSARIWSGFCCVQPSRNENQY